MDTAGASAAPSWLELLGSNSWAGLLQPLNPELRRLILHCGDFNQATYDAFNSDPRSKYCGSSRYGKTDFFRKAQLDHASATGYEVVAFLYATADVDFPGDVFLAKSRSREAWDKESNWIGYIAVSNDEKSRELGRREIYVAWRGTIRDLEWLNVFEARLQPIDLLLSDNHKNKKLDSQPKIMKGWYSIYTANDERSPFCKLSARDQLHAKINELVGLYRNEEISIVCVGHSLGASLAIVSAFDMVENGLNRAGDGWPEFPVAAIVFGSPQIGNKSFNDVFNKLEKLNVLHVRNEIDLITHYPGSLLSYQYTGVELVIDTRKSTYLKDSKNPSDWHNLQAILHVVAGWKGKEEEFELQVKRSIALVNKSCDFLKEELLVPPSWWSEKNKGMVMGEDGEWYLALPAEEDLPVPEF